jgi:hypothetical protein
MSRFNKSLLMLATGALFLHPQAALADELRDGGKLLLTNGISSLEGASGGGLTPWAVIAGNATKDGIGVSGHATVAEVKSYDFQSAGLSIGFFDRLELSYSHQNFNTNEIGGALGLGADYAFKQDVFGAKLKLAGDLVYGAPMMPAIAIGAQYKNSNNDAIVRAMGAKDDKGIDYYVSASKLFLSHSILASATLRATKANQIGLLGFGSDQNSSYSLQAEGSLAWQLSRRFAIGGEYRTKPNNLGSVREDDWFDLFGTYAFNKHLTAAVAYADMGSIASVGKQRGMLFSLQASY